VFGDGPLQANTLAQIRTFAAVFLAPELVAALVLRAFSAQASIEAGRLVFARGRRRVELALNDIAAVEPWRLPLPGFGAALRLRTGERWRHGLAGVDGAALAAAFAAAGGPAAPAMPARRLGAYAQATRVGTRSRWHRPWAKFGLLPLALALPAFRLHQHIAYGGTLGEYFSYGLAAYLKAFALWWAAWAIGVLLCAAVLRAAIEAAAMSAAVVAPARAATVRRWLERLGLAALYVGLPGWLALRLAGG
jgi:apolipoprotein N-acyltransferase